MSRSLALLPFLFLWTSQSFALTCAKNAPTAKFDCARVGDDFASIGDFEGAKKAWQTACDRGLESSCEDVKSLNADPKKFRASWNANPANNLKGNFVKQTAAEASKQKQVIACRTKKASKAACLKQAKVLAQNHDVSGASDLLGGMCASNIQEACFEQGAMLVRDHEFEKSIEPLMTACTANYKNSCSVLQSVQAKVKLDADTDARIGAYKREIIAKNEADERRKQEDNEKFWISMDKLLSPKRTHCKTEKTDSGETTECVEDSKWY